MLPFAIFHFIMVSFKYVYNFCFPQFINLLILWLSACEMQWHAPGRICSSDNSSLDLDIAPEKQRRVPSFWLHSEIFAQVPGHHHPFRVPVHAS